MIEINLTTAFPIYLGSVLALIFIVSWGHALRQRHDRYRVPHQKLLDCEFCHYTFLMDLSEHYARCPQCHCLIHVTREDAR